ncbi:hypothetical protein K9L16_03660 [Candidatus Pacearchaeota archaeon]|nr:hypothetical protein [Candidatus Pacearchaeota archaeon]
MVIEEKGIYLVPEIGWGWVFNQGTIEKVLCESSKTFVRDQKSIEGKFLYYEKNDFDSYFYDQQV